MPTSRETFLELEKKICEQITLRLANTTHAGMSEYVIAGDQFSLLLSNDGTWLVNFLMSGYKVGKNPDFDQLLDDVALALAHPDRPDFIGTDVDDANEARQQKEFLDKNRDSLTATLIEKMTETLKRLEDPTY